MALHRFFAEEVAETDGRSAPAGAVPLSPADIHHLRDVLRLTPGDEIIVVSGGVASLVRLTDVGDEVFGERISEVPAPRLPRVTLVQGLAKGEKMDDIVRQVTEIGARRIIPFAAERSVVKLDAKKAAARVERWRRVAAGAAKQSQRVDVPTVCSLAEVAELPALLTGSTLLVCWEDATDAPGIGAALKSAIRDDDRDVAVVVGPEGGLTADEVAQLVDAGAMTVSLGATVLRTETAGVVATALAVFSLGGLGGSVD